MSRKRMHWQLYPSYLFIVILSVAAMGLYGVEAQRQGFLRQVAEDLESRAHIIRVQAEELLLAGDHDRIRLLCDQTGHVAATRITIIGPDGVVYGDSDRDPRTMENHLMRPEVQDALNSGMGVATRWSHTVERNLMYVAIVVHRDGELIGIVRTSVPVSFIDRALRDSQLSTAAVGIGIALLAAGISWLVARRISRPIEELKRVALSYAKGEFEVRMPVPESEEIAQLTMAMNDMAAQLSDRINTITRQRREQEAVLSSMIEGVLAFDTEERLLDLNQAATVYLSVTPEEARGLTVREAIRNPELQDLIVETLSSKRAVQRSFEFTENGDTQYAQASATALRDPDGHEIGALVVINDITKIRKLERLRSDFVANVSHELKTPLTSILGSVETLLDGMADGEEDRQRFLKIIKKHSNRLHYIIEDLLSLSRIEQQSEDGTVPLEVTPLLPILESAEAACDTVAAAIEAEIHVNCPAHIMARANSSMLEQAIINLLDNAIKYGEVGSSVELNAFESGGFVRIQIKDEGPGIDSKHLTRLFERFYRVDKGRSREMGGTGLGLAIVKHIALAHGGRVEVESRLGEGSCFTISLPSVGRGSDKRQRLDAEENPSQSLSG